MAWPVGWLALTLLLFAHLTPGEPQAEATVVTLTIENAAEFQRQGKPKGKLFFTHSAAGPEAPPPPPLAQWLEEAASRHGTTISFATIDLGDPVWASEAGRFGVEAPRPTFVIDAPPFKYVLRSELTPSAILTFCENYTKGTLEPYYRSAQPPRGSGVDDNGIETIVSTTFQEFMVNQRRHTIINLYRPDCPNCQAFAPIYAGLARRLTRPPFAVAMMDVTVNDVPLPFMFPERGYPTVYLTSMQRKQAPDVYEGPYDVEALAAWVQERAGHPGHVGLSMAEALQLREEAKRTQVAQQTEEEVRRTAAAQAPTKEELRARAREARLQSILDRHRAAQPAQEGALGGCPSIQKTTAAISAEVQALRHQVARLEGLLQTLAETPCPA